MTETAKTMTFVAIGAVALLGAYFINAGVQPVDVQELVGASLNAELDVDAPKRLRIVKFDPETASTRQFEVAATDEGWSIPSKEGYPADATRQMAAAANALINRKILRVAAETAEAHSGLGVVDPLSAKLGSNSTGVGTRVVMHDGDDQVLVDMIIGQKVKDAEGQRYVRKSNQDVVYVVELDPESMSTSFEDWIEDDLLKLSPFDIRRVFINDYSAELSLGMTPDGQLVTRVNWDRRGELTLTYDNDQAKWQLADLKKFDRTKGENGEMVEDSLAEDEEVNQDALGELRTGLDELLIVDIARKPAGLSDDLKAGNDFLSDREAAEDLIDKGFSPVPLKQDAPPEILSSEGEVVCTLRDGVEYVLRFGQLQVQTESAAEGDNPAAADDLASAAPEDAESDDAGGSSAEKNLRRYLFVMARFNEEAVEKPVLKELPPLPEGADAPAEGAEEAEPEADLPAEEEAEAPAEGEQPGGDQPEAADPNEPTDEQSPSEEPPSAEPATAEAEPAAEDEDAANEEKPTADAAALAARQQVEEENQRLQDEYQQTIADGKKRVTELNERFGDWYYVISNDVYKQIHLGRDEVIKKKEPPAEEAAEGAAPGPLSGLPNLPLGEPAAAEPPAAEPESAEEPATEPAVDAAAEAAAEPTAEEPADEPAAE